MAGSTSPDPVPKVRKKMSFFKVRISNCVNVTIWIGKVCIHTQNMTKTLRKGIFGADPDLIARTKTPLPISYNPSTCFLLWLLRRALLGSQTAHCPASKQRNGVLDKRHLSDSTLRPVQRPLKTTQLVSWKTRKKKRFCPSTTVHGNGIAVQI